MLELSESWIENLDHNDPLESQQRVLGIDLDVSTNQGTDRDQEQLGEHQEFEEEELNGGSHEDHRELDPMLELDWNRTR